MSWRDMERVRELRESGASPALIAMAEAAAEGLSPEEAQLALLRRAHGHLCAALGHLFHAASLFAETRPDWMGAINHHARGLSALIPGEAGGDA